MLGQRQQSSVDPCELSVLQEQQDLHARCTPQATLSAADHNPDFCLTKSSQLPPLNESGILFVPFARTSTI